MKRVKCKSGRNGWRAKLRKVYKDFDEFEAYSDIYGLAKRLGFADAQDAWEINPTIEGSTDPSDYRISR